MLGSHIAQNMLFSIQAGLELEVATGMRVLRPLLGMVGVALLSCLMDGVAHRIKILKFIT
jgi:hypothetical protein